MTEIENNEQIAPEVKAVEESSAAPCENDANPAEDNNNPFKAGKAPKRKKIKKSNEQETTNDNEANGDSIMPTPPPSKRQKKKEKRLQNIVRNKDKEVEKTVSYLTTWHTNRDEWKYEKLRQIFIQKNIFDEESIPDEHCEVAIQYLATSKGHARQIIVEAAEKAMKEVDDKITDENRNELTSSSKYKRAREILQSMQD